MKESFKAFFCSVCGSLRFEEEFDLYVARCPLCRGNEFMIHGSGWWKCGRCKEKGNVWGLILGMYGKEVGLKVLKKSGITGSGILEKKTEKLYKWLSGKGRKTRVVIVRSQKLTSQEMDLIQGELEGDIEVKPGGGLSGRGVKGETWEVKKETNIAGYKVGS